MLQKIACSVVLLLLPLEFACRESKEEPKRPNIVLVSVDCLRADHLPCYGYDRPTAPTIDALAAGGVRFDRAISSSGWTLPSHLSMLTGLRMSAHGVEDDRLWSRVDENGQPVPSPFRGTFVSESLHDAGYATAGFFTALWLDPKFGFGPGFDVWERWGHTFNSHPVIGPIYRQIRANRDLQGLRELRRAHPELFGKNRPCSPETIDRAIGWVDEHHGRAPREPFFVFMHLFDAHSPYAPPAPYDRMFAPKPGAEPKPDPEQKPDATPKPDAGGENGVDSDDNGAANAPSLDTQREMSQYDGEIRLIDAQLARLVKHLEDLGIRRDTLIVITGDHGEEFGEHGMMQHRNHLYLEDIHVPLILNWPAGLPAGRVVSADASLVDIAPTLLAAAGIASKSPTSGRNLLPEARGESAPDPGMVISELAAFDGRPTPTRHLTILRGNEMRVLQCRGRSPWEGFAFDLAQNPKGSGPGTPLDLSGDEGARLTRDLAELRTAMTNCRGGSKTSAHAARRMEKGDHDELKSIGYAGSEEQIVTRTGPERLFLDGGVWPDE